MGAPTMQPNPQQPLGGQMDPRSQYLAAALQSMGQQKPTSGAGVGEDLLAQALMQAAMQRQQGQQGQGVQNSLGGSLASAGAGMMGDGGGNMGGGQGDPSAAPGGGFMGGGGMGSGWLSKLGGLIGLGQAAGGG